MNLFSNNGFLQKRNNRLVGEIIIDDVNLSPIEGRFFVNPKDAKQYLWIKRQQILEYDEKKHKYVTRESEPRWQVYMQKVESNYTPYVGEFTFLHFKYKIEAVWDLSDYGKSKKRINLYIERLPNENQTIINEISKRRNG